MFMPVSHPKGRIFVMGKPQMQKIRCLSNFLKRMAMNIHDIKVTHLLNFFIFKSASLGPGGYFVADQKNDGK
jgi:hypothetical protein